MAQGDWEAQEQTQRREHGERYTHRIPEEDTVRLGTQDTVPQDTGTQDTAMQDATVTQEGTVTQETVAQDAAAEDEGTRPTLPHTTVTQGSYFETHMQRVLGVTDHAELHRRIHEAARKVQEDAEHIARSGTGTSEYLKWRLSMEGDWASMEGRSMAVLGAAASTDNPLQPPGLNTAPGLADINMTVIRHGSVTAPWFVDWRASSAVSTGVYDQKQVWLGTAQHCWAVPCSVWAVQYCGAQCCVVTPCPVPGSATVTQYHSSDNSSTVSQ